MMLAFTVQLAGAVIMSKSRALALTPRETHEMYFHASPRSADAILVRFLDRLFGLFLGHFLGRRLQRLPRSLESAEFPCARR